MKLAGETRSGYYNIKKENSLYPETVYCDLSHGGYENVPEIDQLSPLLPVGSIIPWVNRPIADSKNTIKDIPEGWQR